MLRNRFLEKGIKILDRLMHCQNSCQFLILDSWFLIDFWSIRLLIKIRDQKKDEFLLKMSGFLGVVVSDSLLENRIPQVELRNLESQVSNFICIYWSFDYDIEEGGIIGLVSDHIWNFAVSFSKESVRPRHIGRFVSSDVAIKEFQWAIYGAGG